MRLNVFRKLRRSSDSRTSRDVVVVGKTSKLIKGDYGKKGDQFRRYEE